MKKFLIKDRFLLFLEGRFSNPNFSLGMFVFSLSKVKLLQVYCLQLYVLIHMLGCSLGRSFGLSLMQSSSVTYIHVNYKLY